MLWIIVLITLLILGLFFVSILSGAPFVPTEKRKIKEMLQLARLKQGEKLVDLGAGDGRIVKVAARMGARAVGYEVNPLLVIKAQRNLPSKAKILWRNFWLMSLSDFDVVTVYGINPIMKPLGKKLAKELKKGARVVSYRYALPNLPLAKQKGDVYLYVIK